MKKPIKIKVPKIKVSETDLKNFAVETMKIDPYWDDLYNPVIPKKPFTI